MNLDSEHDFGAGSATGNPLDSDDPRVWERVVDAVGPASMLVVIDARLGPLLRGKLTAEDIWQETLMHAWRDRRACRWVGVAEFRRWLIGIAQHRIADAVDFFGAQRRASDRERTVPGPESVAGTPELFRTTTPSRMAVHREQAEHMREALSDLPEEQRSVLRLRLFEGLTIEATARQLGLGISAARHRYRKAALAYRRGLFRRLGTERRTAFP